MRSRSIAVSTSGFHPDNAGSTPAEITKEKEARQSLFLFGDDKGEAKLLPPRLPESEEDSGVVLFFY